MHITESTLDHLHGEFDTEPARGDQRNASLANQQISTYFVVFQHPRKVGKYRADSVWRYGQIPPDPTSWKPAQNLFFDSNLLATCLRLVGGRFPTSWEPGRKPGFEQVSNLLDPVEFGLYGKHRLVVSTRSGTRL